MLCLFHFKVRREREKNFSLPGLGPSYYLSMKPLIRYVVYGKKKNREAPQLVIDTRNVNPIVKLLNRNMDIFIESINVNK